MRANYTITQLEPPSFFSPDRCLCAEGPCAMAIGTAAGPAPANCCCSGVGLIESHSHAPPIRNTEPGVRAKVNRALGAACGCVFHVCGTLVTAMLSPNTKKM